MPNLARYLVLGLFSFALVACLGMLVRDTRARVQRTREELRARRLAGGFKR
jgi:uncharacterized protein involved in exopolysaccharide biosynthesis